MTKLAKEFREFVAGGNLVELAVAFIMGGLFATLVDALVKNVVTPIISIPFGKPNLDQALVLTINDADIRIGAFLTVAISVVLTALAVFLLIVKPYNAFRRQRDAVPEMSEKDVLLQIRDLLSRR